MALPLLTTLALLLERLLQTRDLLYANRDLPADLDLITDGLWRRAAETLAEKVWQNAVPLTMVLLGLCLAIYLQQKLT